MTMLPGTDTFIDHSTRVAFVSNAMATGVPTI